MNSANSSLYTIRSSRAKYGKSRATKRLPAHGDSRILARFSRNPIQDFSMVVIRLARSGAKKRPFYNIVAADSRNRRDGRFIERVGFYNPMASGGEQTLSVNVERLNHWTSNGAQMSDAVQRLVKTAAKAA